MQKLKRNRWYGSPDLINVVLGCWLFLSPFVLGHFEEMTSSMNAYLTSVGIMIVASYAQKDYHLFDEVFVGSVALWLMLSPLILRFDTLTQAGTWNAVITGLAVMGLSVLSAMSDHSPLPQKAA